MREIKFRCVLEKIASGKIIKKVYTFNDVISSNELNGNCGYIVKSRDQFCGLDDKSGIEIYENGIRRNSLGNLFILRIYDLFTIGAEYKDGTVLPVQNIEATEYVGNVFENPELLEGWKCTN